MPRTEKIGSASLQIDVASPPSWTFAAGDTIIGTVIRLSPIVAPEATVTIDLIGRVKTKISVRKNTGNGTRTEHYRGRWILIRTSQVLHRGPLHLAEGHGIGSDCLSWPFSIEIPTRPLASLAQNNSDQQSYLPLNNVAEHPLPGSFYSFRNGWSTKSEAFVEYYLESTIRYTRKGSYETGNATRPVTLQHPSSGSIPASQQLQRRTFQITVQTQRLLPGMEHAELSFTQKTKKFFHSSKVPTFGFNIEIHLPSAIELEIPSPIPFVIKFSSNTVSTSPIIQDTVQTVRLNSVRMLLKSTTTVIAPGNFLASNTHNDTQSNEHDLGLHTIFSKLEKPIEFESTKGDQEVDIGTMLQLILCPNGLYTGSRRLGLVSPISPDFVTYNIKHWNALLLEFLFTVADEKVERKFSVPIKIMPPARQRPELPEYSKKQEDST
ncbi:hypothetical protein BGW36DRAFT_303750 [Talaromyces proteolyticus]|uniref:Arrestin-like N-terminal domain-containing protein n=1 Tax=Talaromyces proteolyticus TaxID=1131652 RepID=A0AAD4KJB0_9EURO|nr:uncharacterized protein BGW36DRAFT_303750 [Talaromyces proteolyticus]KAH8692319.1 hypothetical protein BGW36DRAFT_303750 [Talaromyces proteolyticus]